jgi:hypothetical protein
MRTDQNGLMEFPIAPFFEYDDNNIDRLGNSGHINPISASSGDYIIYWSAGQRYPQNWSYSKIVPEPGVASLVVAAFFAFFFSLKGRVRPPQGAAE